MRIARITVSAPLSLALLIGFAVGPVLANAIDVNSLADGGVASDGACTLREAITAANTDVASGDCPAGADVDTISFSVAGTVTLASALPDITTDLSIDGAGAITISGNMAVGGLQVGSPVVSPEVSLSGLAITAGFKTTDGGGLTNWGTLVVSDSTISGNEAPSAGGGIHNFGTMTIANSTISGNAVTGLGFGQGGGIANGGTLFVSDSTISGNSASAVGGGIYNNGTLTVADSTISGNDGGGIYNSGTLTVTRSTISDNTENRGGGIANFGALTVASSTFSGNEAFQAGGGIYHEHGTTLTVANSTLSGNQAGVGGGIYIFPEATMTLTNSTISANTATGWVGFSCSSCGGGIAAEGTEAIVNSIVAGNTGLDILGEAESITTSVIGLPAGMTLAETLDPAGLAANGGPTQTIALALVPGNPAINTGTGATCAAAPINGLDQRGLPRPAACDIGAYEAQSSLPSTPAPAPTATPGATATSGVGELPDTATTGRGGSGSWLAIATLLVATVASVGVRLLRRVRVRRPYQLETPLHGLRYIADSSQEGALRLRSVDACAPATHEAHLRALLVRNLCRCSVQTTREHRLR